MNYAQTNYPQIQGINGKYTIAQIGCFITSFCNLISRYGAGDVDPAAMNNWLRDNGRFVDVDDGIRDDVGFSTITAYNGNITVTGTGKGLPPVKDAIVKFSYISSTTKKPTTHFCLYDGDGFIIDSWDGKRKAISSTRYGSPVGYATYAFKRPEVVKPVSQNTGNTAAASPEAKRFRRLETPLHLQSKVGVDFWFTNFASYPQAKSHHKTTTNEEFWAFGVYDHPLGGSRYYMNEFDFGNADQDGTPTNWLGFNPVDLEEYKAPVAAPAPVPAPAPAPAPAPEPVKKAELIATPVAPQKYKTNRDCKVWNFDATTWPQITSQSVQDLPAGTEVTIVESVLNKSLLPDGATYFVRQEDAGKTIGINRVDLQEMIEDEPTPTPVKQVPPASDVVPVTVKPSVDPTDWQGSFKTNYAGSYIALHDLTVKDFETGTVYPIRAGKTGTVIGFFVKDGTKYYRLKKHNNDEWVGVPMNAMRHLTEDEDFEEAAKEVIEYANKMRDAAIKQAGKIDGLVAWITSLFKKKK